MKFENIKLNLKPYQRRKSQTKELVGVDVFVHWNGLDPNEIGAKMKELAPAGMELSIVSNRGIKVWPDGLKETFCTDHWRCRFKSKSNPIDNQVVMEVLKKSYDAGMDVIKTENLYYFDGKQAFSFSQGQ